MSYINCPKCGTEYYLQKNEYPFKDIGGSVECDKCGETLKGWGKGCIDYTLIPAEKARKKQELEMKRLERAPLCPTCNCKMVLRSGHSWFWGCPRYPNCNGIRELRDSDYELL